MLTLPEVVAFLLGRGLIVERAIVDGDLDISEASRRNHNLIVKCAHGPSYMLKEGVDQARATTLANEASVYAWLQSFTDCEGTRLRRYLPHCYGYDPHARILILEFVPRAENLREYHTRRRSFSTSLARALGDALGTVHGLARVQGWSAQGQPSLTVSLPWILNSFYWPTPDVYNATSSANLRLLQIVQQFPELCRLLDQLRQAWDGTTLIHGDMKWDNCIVFSPSASGRKSGLKIVDWELASLGDPCWDIGSAMSDYLWFWLASIPVVGEEAPEQFVAMAPYSLESMHPAITALWTAYVHRMGLNALTAETWLLRTVQYAAVRLMQSAYEQMQNSVRLAGTTIQALQLSFNMLTRPREAALFLLGL